jgi:Sulfotransferase family
MNRAACLPDFIGIGAQKAGTTWLGHNLQLHPDVWMPRNRELHYFDDRINDPKNPISRLYGKMTGKGHVHRRWRRQAKGRLRSHSNRLPGRDLLWDLRYYVGAPDDGWYASLFEPGRGKVKGEITPAYSTLRLDEVAHVHDLVPEAKIIFLMRNPIERAWSQFVMRLDRSGKRGFGLTRHNKLLRNVEREGSRSRTDYLQALKNWTTPYPDERIFVGFLEDIHFYPEELLGDVYRFLGVDASFRPQGVGERVHARSAGRMTSGAAVDLAGLYREELSRLSEHFGGYASFWSYCAEKLAGDPPEGEYVPYPLWESAIWEDWIQKTAGKPGYQSGLLPAVKTAV